MTVTSTTLATIPVFQFSGTVTDAQIKTAWSALITNGIYVLNRAIYLDDTADLTAVSGGFLVDFGTQVSPSFVLHTGRDKTKSTFNNFTFIQHTGLSVPTRQNFVQSWNGTTLTPIGGNLGKDGVSQKGGGTVYGVAGNPGGGDPRYLNEMAFSSIDGATIYSQEFSEQELQPCVTASTQLKGLVFEKCFGFPQIGTLGENIAVVVYRSTQNTQTSTQKPLRIYPAGGYWASLCYVDSYVTRNNATITSNLIDTYGSSASNVATVMILNNYTLESWFGASKTSLTVASWASTNSFIGGVLKKLQFVGGSGGVVRCYDSRSSSVAQKSSFKETGFSDFLDSDTAPTPDANGKIALVHVGAIATGASATIARYTGQKYTFQKFGYRVIVDTPTMTSGDNDLSSYTPIILDPQAGITRTPAQIASATTINTFQQLLEELHSLAITLTGSASYAGAYGGNLFDIVNGELVTAFTTVNVDATAANKIVFDAATNTLTIKSSVLASNSTITAWSNPTGVINVTGGAKIEGVYETSTGRSTQLELRGVTDGSAVAVYNNTTGTTDFYTQNSTGSTQTFYVYYPPGTAGAVRTVAREKYGYERVQETLTLTADVMWKTFIDIPDAGITETVQATVNAYTAISDLDRLYDAVASLRVTAAHIQKGQIVTRVGSTLELDTYSVLVKSAATSLITIATGVITVKASTFTNGTRYTLITATPPATVTADTTETVTADIEDGNGDSSVEVKGGEGPFQLWKVPTATATSAYATGTLLTTVTGGVYRFVATTGYDIVGVDTVSGVRRRSSMVKGIYTQLFYVGDQIQLVEQPQIQEILDRVVALEVDVSGVADLAAAGL